MIGLTFHEAATATAPTPATRKATTTTTTKRIVPKRNSFSSILRTSSSSSSSLVSVYFYLLLMVMMSSTSLLKFCNANRWQTTLTSTNRMYMTKRSTTTMSKTFPLAFVTWNNNNNNNNKVEKLNYEKFHKKQQQNFKRLEPFPSSKRWFSSSVSSSSFHKKIPSSSSSFSLFSSKAAAAEEEILGDGIFTQETTTFESIGVTSPILLQRLAAMGLTRPTQIQAKAFPAIYNNGSNGGGGGDVTIGAETGSGKTLAYLLPLIQDILNKKQGQNNDDDDDDDDDGWTPKKGLSYDYARALILVPNKELVQQVVRMAIPLCGGGNKCVLWGAGTKLPEEGNDNNADDDDIDPNTIVRLAVMPGGLADPLDFKPFRDTLALGGNDPPVDLLISTPAAVGPLGLKPKHITMFADIATLVVDEADMLLDGGYIRPLENVLLGFRRADRLDPTMNVPKTQHVFVAATLPDMGLKSVDAYLQRKFPYATRIQMAGMHNARHYGLAQATVWYQVESKKERMEQLIELLETKDELQGEKVMVFLNSVEDVEGATGALQRAGIPCVSYHAKLTLGERSENLDRFRRYDNNNNNVVADTVPVLVCTDLASRGLDVPGVTAVVQLQFSGNVVSHLHRMGRCGRAGQRTGRGIVFHSEVEAELVKVVQDAERQQERMVLEGDVMDDSQDNDNDGGDDEEGGAAAAAGTVQKAFSRKRGFTKKRKKLKREGTSSD